MYSKRIVIYLVLSMSLLTAGRFGESIREKWCKKFTGTCNCDSKNPIEHSNLFNLRGPPGVKGEPGMPGMQGFTGIPGYKGEPGLRGVDGIPGTPGMAGLRGDKGSRGLDGVPGIPGINGVKGEKGDKGDLGVSGDRGKDGPKGEQGEKGVPGIIGQPGHEGQKGKQGEVGLPGLPGHNGEKGEKGAVGIPGEKGDIGKTGPKGDTGLTGPPGPRGLEGTCSCPKTKTEEDYETAGDSAVPITSTGEVPRACKFVEDADSINEELILSKDGTKNTMFKVYCKGRKTCLKPKTTNSEISYNTTVTFMMSTYSFDPRYEIEKDALLSLQSLSANVVQHIKIHCLNSHVYRNGDYDESKSITFVTWNDLMLRSRPTEDNPFYFYTVDNDGCRNSSKEWKMTEIVLESDKAERLPITDIQVRDVRGEEQHLRVELGELCFY